MAQLLALGADANLGGGVEDTVCKGQVGYDSKARWHV